MHRSPLFTADSSVSKSPPRFSAEPPDRNPPAHSGRVAVSHALKRRSDLLAEPALQPSGLLLISHWRCFAQSFFTHLPRRR